MKRKILIILIVVIILAASFIAVSRLNKKTNNKKEEDNKNRISYICSKVQQQMENVVISFYIYANSCSDPPVHLFYSTWQRTI